MSLLVAAANEVRGITASDAARSINGLLCELEVSVAFRHVRLQEVTLGLYEDVLREALDRGLVVGLGVDHSRLASDARLSQALHVFRVVTFKDRQVILFDDSRECDPPEFARSWDEVERAVLSTSDGFWLFGPAPALALSNTLPWRAEVPT